jgi:hypothetical protein
MGVPMTGGGRVLDARAARAGTFGPTASSSSWRTLGQLGREVGVMRVRLGAAFVFLAYVLGASAGAPTPAEAQASPNIAANLIWDLVTGGGWPDGATVTLEIDDPTNGAGVDYTDQATAHPSPDGPDFQFELAGTFDIQPGHEVSVSDGTTTKTHTVTALAVTHVDPDSDTVSGTAAPGSDVHVGGGPDPAFRLVQADGAGNWTADFSVPGPGPGEADLLDIQDGECCGNAHQRDGDDDTTELLWQAPAIQVEPVFDQVTGSGWIVGSTVTLEIDDPTNGPGADHTDQTTAQPDFNTHSFQFQLGGVFDIQAGHQVTVSDGTTTTTHTVTDLVVTAVDYHADTVSGTAAPGSEVTVEAGGHTAFRHVQADGAGNWTADFSVPGTEPDEQSLFDIAGNTGNTGQPSGGRVWQADDDNDTTQVLWQAPNLPQLWVDAVNDDVLGGGFGHWPIGVTVTMEIDDPTNGPGVDYSDSAVTASGQGPFGLFEFEFDPAGVFDIQPGHVVTASDGLDTKTLVVTELAATGFDFDTDTLSGTAAPGSDVTVFTGGPALFNTEADATGAWSVTTAANVGTAWNTDADGDHTSHRFAFGATILGTVLGDGGAVLPQSGVVACPVPVTAGPNGFCVGIRFAFADGDGNVTLNGIPPGTYSVVGFQLGDPGQISPEVIVELDADDVITCSFTLGTNPSGACDGAVQFDFTGFFAPVDNAPTVNTVNAGRAIPVKFSLSGDQGMDIFAEGSPVSRSISCDTQAPTDAIEETATTGDSGLTYDAEADQYVFVWQTSSNWEGTCRQLEVTLADGSVHTANFEFR